MDYQFPIGGNSIPDSQQSRNEKPTNHFWLIRLKSGADSYSLDERRRNILAHSPEENSRAFLFLKSLSVAK